MPSDGNPSLTLLLDLGSSRLKWSLRDESGVERASGADADITAGVAELARTVSVPPGAAWLARVGAPERSQRLHEALATAWPGLTVEEVEPRLEAESGVGPGAAAQSGVLVSRYAHGQLGVDRYCALLAARARDPGQPVVLVDAGTAVTVDVLRADGVHIGGYILPGLHGGWAGMQKLLSDRIAPRAPGAGFDPWPERSPGQSTAMALDRGWATAWAAGVAAVVAAGRESLADTPYPEEGSTGSAGVARVPVCLLTGGDARMLMEDLPGPVRTDPRPVLDGLAVLAGLELADESRTGRAGE